MAQWITFDQQTSSLLRTKLLKGTAIKTFGRGAVDYALAKPGAVVTLLPALGGADVGLAVFRRPLPRKFVSPQAPRSTDNPPMSVIAVSQPMPVNTATRAGGFLGLSDEPVFEEEPVQEKKGWWRKFWED